MADPAHERSCVGSAAVSFIGLGAGMIALSVLLDRWIGRTDDPFCPPEALVGAFGALSLFLGLLLAWIAGMACLILTERGSLGREAAVAAGVTWLPCLILGGLLVQGRHLPTEVAGSPRWIVGPAPAAAGTVVLVGWLAVFAWRVRGPAPGDAG